MTTSNGPIGGESTAAGLTELPDGWDKDRLQQLADTIQTTDRVAGPGTMTDEQALAEARRRLGEAGAEPGLPEGWTERDVQALLRFRYQQLSDSQDPEPISDGEWEHVQRTQPATVQMLRRALYEELDLITESLLLRQSLTDELALVNKSLLERGLHRGTRQVRAEQVLFSPAGAVQDRRTGSRTQRPGKPR
jgi:hypothetical protein